MDHQLALKILDAILLSARRKIKLSTLKNFFQGFDLDELISLAKQRYQDLGFFIYRDKDSLELVTRPELANYLINFFGLEENELAQELLEVLAIIAYGGPIKLEEINQIRNKKSASIIKELLNEGLIKKENKNYKVSEKFLHFLGFKSSKELPDYNRLRKEIKRKS
ncbi:MAG: SMC-Scp complex subunit ScpB [Candidatus Parcubacteria bacterium]|nr:MAG: SMC-Scp complex subunit ScpB [Candidatus Parcubacteria bacterium]GIW67130.1 MAG: SMC-Scp complex subunit ScpB [Candidatus Parcubacteria bacterium]GIW67305.1 MAG: SMC-Scp complex subunit ScpB [Candidatus Parcubacteria bacterium]